MLQPFDKAASADAGSAEQRKRADWLALLARSPLALLEPALPLAGPWRWLRAPETGLMMVQGRVGGTGERFNLGEVSVTRCTLRTTPGSGEAMVGVGYVMGRSQPQAQAVALIDAMLQVPTLHERLTREVLEPVRQHLAAERAHRAQQAQRTKVEFFTVARESDAGARDDE